MLRERRRHANLKPNRKFNRKSSRGMVYENEELRIRTININAEVERGQSDIKKLRRENHQLRKEIWSLRDEYDRLDKLLRGRNYNSSIDNGLTNADRENGIENDDDRKCSSCQSSEDSSSCDTCNDVEQSDENENCIKHSTKKVELKARSVRNHINQSCETNCASNAFMLKQCRSEKLQSNSDHLSVVSEECLSNSDDQTEKNKPIKVDKAQFISEIPTTPLSHFENLSYRDIGPNVDAQGEIHDNNNSNSMINKIPNSSKTRDSSSPQQANVRHEVGFLHSSSATEHKTDSPDYKPNNVIATIKTREAVAPAGIVIDSVNIESDRHRPDFHISNVLAAASTGGAIKKQHQSANKSEPIYAEISKKQKSKSPSIFQTGGNLEDLLLDIEHLSNDIEQMQFENNRIYEQPKFPNNIDGMPHPYRSEMNLILSFDGSKSSFVEKKNVTSEEPSMTSTAYGEKSGTPPPKIPIAMELLPNTLPYVKKDATMTTNRSASDENNALAEMIRKPLKIPVQENANDEKTATVRRHFSPQKAGAPEIKIIVHENKASVVDTVDRAPSSFPESSPKSHEPTLKGALGLQLETLPTITVAPSSDTEAKSTKTNEDIDDPIKKHCRRVSINSNYDRSTKEGDHTDVCENEDEDEMFDKSEEVYIPSLTARRETLSRKKSQDSLRHLLLPGSFLYGSSSKTGRRTQKSGSFLNSTSPKSGRRNQKSGSFLYGSSSKSAHRIQKSGALLNTSSPKSTRRIQEPVLPLRRYSPEGLIHQAIAYHPQHRGSTSSNYGHNNKERCSYNAPTATASERCSSSIASSRESSSSFSQRSVSQHKSQRKMSISSHEKSNGKIPWCACWGNGCF